MNRGWGKGQKEKFRATMAAKKKLKKKPGGNVHNTYEFKAAENMIDAPVTYAEATMKPESALGQAQDNHRLAEFNFRRGLVTAMECILRELR